MAVTAALCFVGHNSLRYLLTQDGAAGTTLTITSVGIAGGATDLQVASVAGPIKNIANVVANGYGAVVAGALTQAQARMLLLSDNSGATGLAPAPGLPAANCRLTSRSTAVDTWLVDANVDGSGNPILTVTAPAGAGTVYLDVEVPNAVGA